MGFLQNKINSFLDSEWKQDGSFLHFYNVDSPDVKGFLLRFSRTL